MRLEDAIAKGMQIEWDRAAAMMRSKGWISEKEAEALRAEIAGAEQRAARYVRDMGLAHEKVLELEIALAAAKERSEKAETERGIAQSSATFHKQMDQLHVARLRETEKALTEQKVRVEELEHRLVEKIASWQLHWERVTNERDAALERERALRDVVALLNSMVLSGERHSATSLWMMSDALRQTEPPGGKKLTTEEMDELAGYPLDHDLMQRLCPTTPPEDSTNSLDR